MLLKNKRLVINNEKSLPQLKKSSNILKKYKDSAFEKASRCMRVQHLLKHLIMIPSSSVRSSFSTGLNAFLQNINSIMSCNTTPYTWNGQRDWIVREDFYYHITAPVDVQADASQEDDCSRPLREKNSPRKNGRYTHVPHRDKPPQVVARRNARERRRVQAVNTAFMKLRKAVPFQNNRGKRVSKVKTLQNAIEYINNLQHLLHKDGYCEPLNVISNYCYNPQNDFLDSIDQDEGFETDQQY